MYSLYSPYFCTKKYNLLSNEFSILSEFLGTIHVHIISKSIHLFSERYMCSNTFGSCVCRARQPGVKFIIILDRRLDTWTSIKTALARIAVSKLKSWHFSRVHTCTLVHVEMKSNVIGRIHSLSYLIVGGCEIPMLLALNNAVTRQTSTLNNNTF